MVRAPGEHAAVAVDGEAVVGPGVDGADVPGGRPGQGDARRHEAVVAARGPRAADAAAQLATGRRAAPGPDLRAVRQGEHVVRVAGQLLDVAGEAWDDDGFCLDLVGVGWVGFSVEVGFDEAKEAFFVLCFCGGTYFSFLLRLVWSLLSPGNSL